MLRVLYRQLADIATLMAEGTSFFYIFFAILILPCSPLPQSQGKFCYQRKTKEFSISRERWVVFQCIASREKNVWSNKGPSHEMEMKGIKLM